MLVESLDQLLNPEKPATREIEIEELGVSVLIRGLSAGEQMEFEDEAERHAKEGKEFNSAGLWKIQRCALKSDGSQLFPQGDEGLESVKKLPASVAHRLVIAVNRLNQNFDFEEFLKKYGWEVIGDSNSDSASPSESSTPTTSDSASDS